MKIKRYFSVICIILALLILVGCMGGGNTPSDNEITDVPGEDVTEQPEDIELPEDTEQLDETEEPAEDEEEEIILPYTVTVNRSETEIVSTEGGEKVSLKADSSIGTIYEPNGAVSGVSVYCEPDGEGTLEFRLYVYHMSPEHTYGYGTAYETEVTVTESGYVDIIFPTTVNRKCMFTLSSPTENVSVCVSPNANNSYLFIDGTAADSSRAVASKLIFEEKIYDGEYDMLYLLREENVETPTQMMSYVVKTQNGKIIVIDGGNAMDAAELVSVLQEITGKKTPTVDMWILTHAHGDHYGALYYILAAQVPMMIKSLYYNFIDHDFCMQHDSSSAEEIKMFTDLVEDRLGGVIHTLELGQTLTLDTVSIDVMYVPENVYSYNLVNNSSLLLKMHIGGQTVLFPGDMGVEAGNKVLEMYPNGELESDFCQMAHHGQEGTTKEFYEAVNMKGCLWNTPLWLWNNDMNNGTGFNTGEWETVIVRGWMDELGVDVHYISHRGTSAIPFPYPFK